STPMPPAPRAENVPAPADRATFHQAGISARQNGQAPCPRPYKPRPCRRHPAFPQCGNERWSARSFLVESFVESARETRGERRFILRTRPARVNEPCHGVCTRKPVHTP